MLSGVLPSPSPTAEDPHQNGSLVRTDPSPETLFARKLLPMGWGSIYMIMRRMKVSTLAVVIYITLLLREKWTKRSKSDDLWEKAHEYSAKRVLNLIVELEGLWVKLGQYLSTCADVLPPAYITVAGLSSPPRPMEEEFQKRRRFSPIYTA